MKNKFNHIILISLDTLRADCINASPRAYTFRKKYQVDIKLKTDKLDSIMRRGSYFNHCISAAPATPVSHAAYFTGYWPLSNGVYEFFNRKLSKPTIFQLAKKSGYKTIFQTDFPIILGEHLGFNRGVDHYYVEDETAAMKKLFSAKNQKTLSFFHFGGIHYPYGFHNLKFGGQDYVNKVLEIEKKYNISGDGQLEDTLDESYRSLQDKKYLFRYKIIIEYLYKNRHYNELFLLYLEGINYFFKNRFDKFISQLLDFVDSNKCLLVIFSDHGEAWDQDCYGHHNSLSQDILRVPLIFYGQGIKAKVYDKMVRTIDLTPTLLDFMIGGRIDESMDGRNLFSTDEALSREMDNCAIAQVWQVGDKHKLSKYQQDALKRKKMTKPLKTFLSSEMIYDGEYKFIRNYDKYHNLTKKIFLKKKNDELSQIRINNRLKELVNILNNYNNLLASKGSKIKEISQTVRDDLLNMGYHI